MPGIVVFGRRWMVASDELVFPFGICVVIRLAWLIVISTVFGVYSDLLSTKGNLPFQETECRGKVNIYLVGYIALLIIVAVMDCLICFASSRGRVFELHKRRSVVPLIYIRFALFIIELIWLVLGFTWIFGKQMRQHCHDMATRRLSQGIVMFNFLFVIGVLVTMYFIFDSAGRLWPKLSSKNSRKSQYGAIHKQIRAQYEKKWEKSCKALFCCTKIESSQDNVFGFVSGLLSEYFQEYLDLVPSDIVAGLILLRRHQKALEARKIEKLLKDRIGNGDNDTEVVIKGKRTVHRHQRTTSARNFNYDNITESNILEDITHFSSYALAIYGWPFYLYDGILCGACNLCFKIRCCAGCCRPSTKDFVLVEDNCCECNLEATKMFLNNHEHEIIYISYKDEVYQPPFFIAVDHKKKSVVVSCRGTLSLKDVLTDVMIEEERIPVEGGDPTWMGHKGMIQSAQFVLDIIIKEGLLEKAFHCDTDRGTDSYGLTVVGHSLGAGVASILAFLLRPKYPALTCFAYSAVGSTFNYSASTYARDFIYSIVVGKDVISRLNLHTLDELRYMIIELLQRSKVPKWKIIRGCLCQCMLCCQSSSKSSHEDYLEHEIEDIPKYEPESSKRYYMGGKVVHIVKTQSIYPRCFGKKKAVYEAVWADVDDFQSILISNLLWKDHIPDTVKEALQSCLPQPEAVQENGPSKEDGRIKAIPEEEVHLLIDPDEDIHITVEEDVFPPADEKEPNVSEAVEVTVHAENASDVVIDVQEQKESLEIIIQSEKQTEAASNVVIELGKEAVIETEAKFEEEAVIETEAKSVVKSANEGDGSTEAPSTGNEKDSSSDEDLLVTVLAVPTASELVAKEAAQAEADLEAEKQAVEIDMKAEDSMKAAERKHHDEAHVKSFIADLTNELSKDMALKTEAAKQPVVEAKEEQTADHADDGSEPDSVSEKPKGILISLEVKDLESEGDTKSISFDLNVENEVAAEADLVKEDTVEDEAVKMATPEVAKIPTDIAVDAEDRELISVAVELLANAEKPTQINVTEAEVKIPVETEVTKEVEIQTEAEIPKEVEVPAEAEVPGETEIAVEADFPKEAEFLKEVEIQSKAQIPKDVEVPTEAEVSGETEIVVEADFPKEAEFLKEVEIQSEAEIPKDVEVPTEAEVVGEVEIAVEADFPKEAEIPAEAAAITEAADPDEEIGILNDAIEINIPETNDYIENVIDAEVQHEEPPMPVIDVPETDSQPNGFQIVVHAEEDSEYVEISIESANETKESQLAVEAMESKTANVEVDVSVRIEPPPEFAGAPVSTEIVVEPLKDAEIIVKPPEKAEFVELPKEPEIVVELPKEAEVVLELPKAAEIIVEPSKEAEVVVESPKEAEIIAELPKEPEVIVEPPEEFEVVSEPPKEAEIIVEPPKKAEVVTEPPKEPEIFVELPEEPEVVVEPPKEPEVVQPKEPEIVIEPPKEAEIVIEPPKEAEIVVELPKEPEVVVEQPKEAEIVIEPPKEAEIVIEPPKEPEIVVEPPKEAEIVIEPPKEAEIVIEPPKEAEVVVELPKEPEIVIEPSEEIDIVVKPPKGVEIFVEPPKEPEIVEVPPKEAEIEVPVSVTFVEAEPGFEPESKTTEEPQNGAIVEPVAEMESAPVADPENGTIKAAVSEAVAEVNSEPIIDMKFFEVPENEAAGAH
eukprot:Seg493.3 transcript_id=Seg493.3/GoldUCD/mRNA.D3Y31 product="Sn1-specific diacylglycerol lipase alpha" protein_id=Seg493.3/GoldUCD/D3Y31